MANNARTGVKVEGHAIAILRHHGYLVYRCLKTVARTAAGPRTIGQDFFGCIDLIAKKQGEPTRWIQVFSTGHVGRKARDVEVVPWTDAHDSVELWRWVGGRHRIDRRSGRPCPRQYFQLYRRNRGFALDKLDRIQAVHNAKVDEPQGVRGAGPPPRPGTIDEPTRNQNGQSDP